VDGRTQEQTQAKYMSLIEQRKSFELHATMSSNGNRRADFAAVA
jgi:hypothetical protein